jgi:metallo-beta-lactamase family protein
MKLTFCGGVQDVTGSSHLVTLDSGFTVLLDCGLYHGNLHEMEYFNQADQFSEPEGPDWREIKNNHIKEIEAMLKEHNVHL